MSQKSKKSINKSFVEHWKEDVQKSVLYYNEWFLKFAPSTYIKSREEAIEKVENIFSENGLFKFAFCQYVEICS